MSSEKPAFRSLDFVVDRPFMKLSKTNNMETVRQYKQFFNIELPSATLVTGLLSRGSMSK